MSSTPSPFTSTGLADVSGAGSVMHAYVAPTMTILCSVAGIAAALFLAIGGIQFMTSSGKPEKLEAAKRTMRNAVVGLVMVFAAATLTALLNHAYVGSGSVPSQSVPALVSIQPAPSSGGLVDILVKAIEGLFLTIVQTAASPFLKALEYFTHATPFMADNPSVFRLWLAITAMADALFVLVIGLLGFHVMSSSVLGMEELEVKNALPQVALTFLLINTSIFAIDAVIGLSNAMVAALTAAFPVTSVWSVLGSISTQSSGLGLVALIIMVVFVVLAVVMLIYYVTRLVVLYLGAILSPLMVLLWLIPSFKDFVGTAVKTYITTVFVLFVHVVILLLAASIFAGMLAGSPDKALNPLMAAVVGIATLVALLKTQSVLAQFAYVSIGARALRKLSSQFVAAASFVSSKVSPSNVAKVAK